MADQATVTVQKINKEIRNRKDGKGTFETTEIISTGGKIFNGYSSELPEGIQEGTTLKVNYQNIKKQDNSTFNKILSAELVNSGEGSTPPQPLSSPTSYIGVSKDTSMEVSGLLQAIIQHHGLNADTESKLRHALNLKRNVARDLEQKGQV